MFLPRPVSVTIPLIAGIPRFALSQTHPGVHVIVEPCGRSIRPATQPAAYTGSARLPSLTSQGSLHIVIAVLKGRNWRLRCPAKVKLPKIVGCSVIIRRCAITDHSQYPSPMRSRLLLCAEALGRYGPPGLAKTPAVHRRPPCCPLFCVGGGLDWVAVDCLRHGCKSMPLRSRSPLRKKTNRAQFVLVRCILLGCRRPSGADRQGWGPPSPA